MVWAPAANGDETKEIDRGYVTRAKIRAINRVAKRVVSVSVRSAAALVVAGDNRRQGIPVRTVRRRARVRLARADKPFANIYVNCDPLTAIRLLSSPPSTPMRGRKGKPLRIGKYRFDRGVIAQAPNGWWQVFERSGAGRYPLNVVKIPVADALRHAFNTQVVLQMKTEMPKELKHEISYELRRFTKK
ncbi:phage tail protein [Salmonella enterica subsp. enterica serovar Enteritidis]|nr:phage tail protein [Salmonella enterica subsp. enterica serovar Enteritidis]EGJ9410198.1 phage tail protein [Salmonella enterica subsp. enterica serovar Enteritidis]